MKVKKISRKWCLVNLQSLCLKNTVSSYNLSSTPLTMIWQGLQRRLEKEKIVFYKSLPQQLFCKLVQLQPPNCRTVLHCGLVMTSCSISALYPLDASISTATSLATNRVIFSPSIIFTSSASNLGSNLSTYNLSSDFNVVLFVQHSNWWTYIHTLDSKFLFPVVTCTVTLRPPDHKLLPIFSSTLSLSKLTCFTSRSILGAE